MQSLILLLVWLVVIFIVGSYHFNKSQTLLAIVQKQYIDYCAEMRDYADDVEQTTININTQASILI